MLKSALEFMHDTWGKTQDLEADDGRTVFSRRVYSPPLPDLPLPVPRQFATLAGLAQFVETNPDGLTFPGDWFIHVAAPNLVELCKSPDEIGNRDVRTRVVCETETTNDDWVTQEELLIRVLGMADAGDRDLVAKAVSRIRRVSAEVIDLADGGQKVTGEAKIGAEWVTTGDESERKPASMNKIVQLAPFRTFPEVKQPLGSFIFRVDGGEGEKTRVKLVTCPDLRWRVQAVESVKAKLDELLKPLKEPCPPVVC